MKQYKHLIHVVEDDLEQADTLIRYLNKDGRFEVVHSEWAEEALEVHEDGVYPVLALIDLNLELEGAGFSVVQDCKNRGIPAIVISARSTSDLDQRFAAFHGSISYLKKPYSVKNLIQQIENVLILAGIMRRGVQLTPRLFTDTHNRTILMDESIEINLGDLNARLVTALIDAGNNYCSLKMLAWAGYGVNDPTLYVNVRRQISRIRDLFHKANVPIRIEGEKGRASRGYRLVLEEMENDE